MNRNICLFYKVIALGAVCAGMFRAVADEDYTYQSLTNLGPCTSSRVLLMNNDTNTTCPIEGQGYHDSSNTVAVGQTYWWHDDTPLTDVVGSNPIGYFMNLQVGANHILYQKRGEGQSPLKLWELVNCRAGSPAVKVAAVYHYLPWSSKCQPIDAGAYAAPILDEWTAGVGNSNGVRQAAMITMRATVDENGFPTAAVYSPFYEDGVGEIYFDAVNFVNSYVNSHIAVEVATEVDGSAFSQEDESEGIPEFSEDIPVSKLKWKRQKCDVFIVTKDSGCAVDSENDGKESIRIGLNTGGYGTKYYRIRVRLNVQGNVRFRIVRSDSSITHTWSDFGDLILLDNIIVSYPVPGATFTPTGIDSDGVGRAQIGRVGAFTEPLLSVGMDTAKPRMTYSANTNGLPSFIPWKSTVTSADFVWRWRYLNQAYGSWTTNTMSLAESGTELIGDSAISVTNVEGDIEYFYAADVAGTRYKFYDFANDTPISPPEAESATAHVQTGGPDAKDNPWSRIREGASPWQEMHLVAITVTNIYDQLTVTNDWTMELIGDHTWRGFVGTPTNYTGCTTYLRFEGRNLWETNGLAPVLDSKTWYFPPGDVTEIPMGSIAVTNLGESAENGIPLDCSASYLVFEFVETSGAFTMNRAEYQNFNRWTPDPGKENLFIGDYIRQGDEIITNISYSASTKQEYSLVLPGLPMSRSTSAYWWENFDQMAGNADYPFDVPFGLNKMTPNGWRASNGMFINGMFSAAVNKTTYGMALQLQGCGLGTLSLIDPADVPQGIGTVGFSARLAQYLDFGDFCYYVDGTADKNYAISAKATMTSQKQPYSDVSIGSPTLSLVAYYRPGQGCYEFRISRVYANYNDLWDATGVMEMAIYKWYKETDPTTGNVTWTSKKLKSLRLGGNSTTYNPQLAIGRYYTNSSGKATQYVNYFVPATSLTNTNNVPDNKNWTSIYFGAYNDVSGTYLEGGVGGTTTTSKDASEDLLVAQSIMMSVNVTDSDSPFQKGSYGVCSRECPAAFGNIQRHSLTGVGPYKNATSKFGPGNNSTTTPNDDRESTHIKNGDWGSTAANRMISWDDRIVIDGVDYRMDGGSIMYSYGLCTAPLKQQLYLRMAPHGDSSNWKDAMKPLVLTSYLPTNIVFSPHTTSPANIQIAVGGSFGDARTDVVVDDIELAQWAAEDSTSTDLGSVNKWAYVDAWIAGTTNEVYQGAGGTLDDDDVATISRCGHYVKKLSDTDFIYVFTNTTAGALASYATFTPKVDLTVKEVFILGGGGGGGPGGGGGGGGEALWITNSVDYTAGEGGIQIYVGNGGGGGTARYSNNSVRPSSPGNGGTSYVWLKNPMNPTGTLQQYRGYGGYRGGWFYRANDTYAAGAGSSGGGGAGGGSALITEGHNPGATIMNSALHTYGREIYGAGYGGAAVDGAPGGGGGGGLRGLGANGVNGAAGSASNPISVIYAGSDGTNGIAGAYGGKGGDGFPLSVLGDSEIRVAIGELLGNQDAWLGGGGGGGSGKNMDVNVATWGQGAEMAGSGGRDSGGQGGQYTAGTYDAYQATMGARGMMFAGGGGGGGSFIEPSTTAGSNNKSHFITGGGQGGGGLVVMHIKVKDRFAMLHPMRGSESDPMSISTPFMNGISLFSFSWKWADPNAVLQVQVATNGVDETTIRTRRRSLSDGWVNIGDPIRFSEVDETRREEGFTNILIGIRAPASGLVRLLMDPAVVRAARIGSTNNLDSMYGAISITGMKAFDEPEIDERSWWGWNIMPTYMTDWTYLYDPVTIGPGRTCALNFAGIDDGTAENAPKFADDPSTADYAKHDPFVQTPVFSNSIGAVSFRARLFTNFTESAWVSISGCTNPEKEEDGDTNWTVLTNIEIEAGTTVFKQYSWRVPSSYSDYKAIRLTTFGAAGGRNYEKESYKPFGDNGTKNPVPIQRVLIDEITVSQPMSPKVALKNAYPFRHNTTKYEAIATEKIVSPDEQPILGETFGVQAQVMPAGMEDELDVQSIRVYLGWYAGESPWGYENWKDLPGAVKKVELKRASDWSVGNLVYRSSPDDAEAFIPPQLAGDNGYQIVQYHLWAEYTNKNGIEQEPHDLTKSDWIMPSWYRGIEDPNKINDPVFCAFTVLDTISPKRAWINEINTFDGNLLDDKHQYLEIAVPQGFDMTGWTLNFLRDDDSYTLYPLANIGYDGVPGVKTMNATNAYAFIAIQSPKTKEAGSYSSDAFKNLNDGAWMRTAFEGGIVDVSMPYALRLLRPTGIIEHEVVFMSTNTSTSRVRYTYEGTNLLRKLVAAFPDDSWMYSGADGDGGSLGVYTNHGEETYCWTNSMKQTPGWVNMTADNVPQFIDEHYFEPPNGTNLWIYANIDGGSVNTLEMVIGNVTNTSAVLIVPQNSDGTFSTSIVYRVRKWFEIDSIVTNEYGHAGGAVPGVEGTGGEFTLALDGITISDPDNRKFEILASARDSSKISALGEYGIDKNDPYYPAVIDWLQNYEEADIQLAEYWNANVDEKCCDLTLKEMYWLDIPPVTESGGREWILKAGFKDAAISGGGVIGQEEIVTSDGLVTNVRMKVIMMITNKLWNAANGYADPRAPYPPYTLRGLEPGSVSSNYNEHVDSNWPAVAFKITGALQNGRVNNVFRPLRWFTFCPDSFGAPGTADEFCRTIDIRYPFSRGQPGFSYEWYKHPGCTILYRWNISDEDDRPPITVQQLNDENALNP